MDDQKLLSTTLHEVGNEELDVDTGLLSYLRTELSEKIDYEIAPKPLTGGRDSRIYQYKLQGEQPSVLRILRPTRDADELLYLQTVYQTLSHHGITVPSIHSVCEDKSILGGSFAVMDLLSGTTLSTQEPETQAKVLGESMAKMHNSKVKPIVDELKESGMPDERFLAPALLKNFLNVLEKNYPWTSEHVSWLRKRVAVSGDELSIIHGDYHAGNLMFEEGSVTGVLDWEFFIADPAIDLAHITNLCLIFSRHFSKDIPLNFFEQYLGKILKTYSKTRPVNHERIRIYRVAELLKLLCFADKIPEQLQSPEAQRDCVEFIENATGIPLMFKRSATNLEIARP